MSPFQRFVCAAFAFTSFALAQKGLAEGPSISPFRGMRVTAEGIEVQVHDATWFVLEKIEGVDAAALLRESKRICGRQWWKRITEDLPALLGAMGHAVGDEVDLVVRDLSTGESKELEGVAMTHAKRQGLRAMHGGREPRIGKLPERVAAISIAQARADLDTLGELLDERFAYRELRQVGLPRLLADAKVALGGGTDKVQTVDLARHVDAILRAFGDGHSRLQSQVPPRHAGYLPFLVQQTAGGYVAFRADRTDFVDRERPLLEAIDGVPLARWLEAARRRGVQGSAAMRSRDAERGLRWLGELRADLSLGQSGRVRVTVRGPSGTDDVELGVAAGRPTYGAWPLTRTRRIDVDGHGAVGYLRIPAMTDDPDDLDELEAALHSFRDTKGLVIDVRGNGGGSRDALRRLLPYLMPADAPPVVTNVAAARLIPVANVKQGLLADRGLHPADWKGFDAAQRGAIGSFLKTFKPSWRLPPRKFSPFHFLVQHHADNPKAYHYDQKVVVLIDRGCYSATDIFAAAFAVLPQVTLVGETTMGGSGRARGYELPNSGLRLQLSSMASFRPDGVLFEGVGVVPDVALIATPRDLIGDGDTVLHKAIEMLR